MPTTVVTPSASSLTSSSGGGANRNIVAGQQQQSTGSVATSTTAPRVPPTRAQPDMNKERMMFMWLSLVGRTVEVKMRNQTIYQGILSGVKPEKDYDIALKYARELPINNKLSGPILDEILISGKDISSLTAKDVPITGIDWKKGPHLSGFKTDSEILPRSSLAGKERVLQRWDSKTDDALDKPLESSFNDTRVTKGGAHWDQFAVNERKFNVKSTYNEDLYTTTLDTSKISPEKQRRAERIAKEIEHSQNYGAKEEGTGVEDEEALFSAVQGTGGYANHKRSQQQQQQQASQGSHSGGGGGPQQQQHSKPQLSPEQISERARMKADFESNLRMLDAGHRYPRAAAASAGNTRLNALNLEPASVRVSHLGRSPKQTSTSPRPPQPLTQENLNSHNRALRYSAVAAAAAAGGGGGSTGHKGGQQTPGSKHSILGASPVITDARKPLPQLPNTTAAAAGGGGDGVSPIVTEMKGINALNLEPALPKLPEKERDDWISGNGGNNQGKGKGGRGIGGQQAAWQQQQGSVDNGTPPLTAKGGKGKGGVATTTGIKSGPAAAAGKGGGSLMLGSPQIGYQSGQQQQQHQPSQLMMNAVQNAQSAAAAAQMQQQQDAGKPPAGKGRKTNLTLESSSSSTTVLPKRGGFSFNPNANTFTPSTGMAGGSGGPSSSSGGGAQGGATLNINVTPGGSLSGTLKNMNYDGYDSNSAQQQGGQGGSNTGNKQQSNTQQQGRQQQQQQHDQQQMYQVGGRGGPLPPMGALPHGSATGMIPPPMAGMMGGGGAPGSSGQGGPPMGMMIPMPPPPPPHAGGYPAAAAFMPPISLPNIAPPPFTPLCDNKSLDKSTLIEVEDKLLESNENENTAAVSIEWPDGSKSSSYKDIISSSATAAVPPTVLGAPPPLPGGYMPMMPAPGTGAGGPHMIMQQQPGGGAGGPMGPIPGMMMQPGGAGAPIPGIYQYPIQPMQGGGNQQNSGNNNNQQQQQGGGGGMHMAPPPPPPGGMYAPMYAGGGGGMPPYYATAALPQGMEGGVRGGGGGAGGGGAYMMGPSGGVLITPDNNEGGPAAGLMPSPPPQQQQRGGGRGGGYYGQQQGGGGRQQQGGGGHRGGGGGGGGGAYHTQQQQGGGGNQ